MKIDHLDAITPGVAKIAAKWRLQLELVFVGKFLSNFLKLRFIANHDPEMPYIRALHFIHFEDGKELVLTQFEEGVALAAAHLFQIENILVKRHSVFDVVYFDGDMITSINLDTHF